MDFLWVFWEEGCGLWLAGLWFLFGFGWLVGFLIKKPNWSQNYRTE